MINDFCLSQEYVRYVFPLDLKEHAAEMRRIRRARAAAGKKEQKPRTLAGPTPRHEPENPALGYF
ncbi:MAG: hypothetical protein ACE5EF_07895 [Dehalococcoidia bacterium]